MEKKLFDYDLLISEHPWIVESGKKFVVSPDADGFYCSMLLTSILNWQCVGFYDGKALLLNHNFDENDIIYVDVEMFNPNKKSIGNHALLPGNLNAFKDVIEGGFKQSINPNLLREISNKEYNRKYPFGTSHFLLSILAYVFRGKLEGFLNTLEKIVTFTYADGMIKNSIKYPKNTNDWAEYLRFNEEWNPLKEVENRPFTMHEIKCALDKFYDNVKSLSKKNQRGDKLSITNQRGGLEACEEKDNGLFMIKEENKSNILRFLNMLYVTFDIKFDDNMFDCWDDLSLTRFEKIVTKPGNKYFSEMFQKNPVSYAITGTNELSYTIKKEDKNGENS